MEKKIGYVDSHSSKWTYPVKWNSEDFTVWIQLKTGHWKQMGAGAKTAESALEMAQKAIDERPGLY